MPDVVIIFEVHQPYRLDRAFRQRLLERLAEEGCVKLADLEDLYLNQDLNRRIIERVARRCYVPATRLFIELLDEYEEFRVSYSFSGVLLEQVERWAPEALDLFKQVAQHSRCEVLGQTYYHSLAYLVSVEEFREQVEEHRRTVREVLGVEPRVFENTELIYDNGVARLASEMGFKAVLTEGVERVLGWRSPNYVYRAKGLELRVLLRNYRLSDDIGFRFAARWWEEYPLTAEKYAAWLAATPGQVICIFMDYETVGEHFPAETGIFEFFKWLPREALKYEHIGFATPSEVVDRYEPVGELDVPEHDTISWADLERDVSAWLHNEMQQALFTRVVQLEPLVKGLGDDVAVRLWKLVTISDHYYYMSTKGGGPGDVHAYFSPFTTPLEAFTTLSDVVADLELRVYRRFEGPGRLALSWLRRLPEDLAFRFCSAEGEPLGVVARSGAELLKHLRNVPVGSLEYHVAGSHLAKWISQVLHDPEAASKVEELKALRGEDLREALVRVLREAFERSLTMVKAGLME